MPKLGKTITEEEYYQIGDTVKIVNYKNPELNPETVENKSVSIEPERLTELHNKFKKEDEQELSFHKKITFPYQLRGMNYVGMTGVITSIRTVPGCDYEKRTGDIATYVVRILDNLSGWKDKKVTLYPSQVIRIKKRGD